MYVQVCAKAERARSTGSWSARMKTGFGSVTPWGDIRYFYVHFLTFLFRVPGVPSRFPI